MQVRANSSENQVINLNSAAQEKAAESAGRKAGRQSKKTSIFAGDLGLVMKPDMITQRKQRAQKKAMKIIGDAWNSDRKTDQTIADYRDKIARLKTEMEENCDQIDLRDEWKEKLRQDYGVPEDSQEQKDLELLEKEADSYMYYTYSEQVYLTDEEKERLAEIHEQGLTEYQERCLKFHGQQNGLKAANDKIKNEIKAYSDATVATKIERLKYHGMVDAQKDAEEVLEAASKEIIGMLIDEAKNHVDEELEEKVEEAKKEAEEKAEEEEKIEERKEKQEELEVRIDEAREKVEEQEELRREAEERSREDTDLLDSMVEAGMGGIGATVADAKIAIKQMLHKMKLLEEDLKGSVIDDKLKDSL